MLSALVFLVGLFLVVNSFCDTFYAKMTGEKR